MELGEWNVVEWIDRSGWWEVGDGVIPARRYREDYRAGLQRGERRHVAEAATAIAVVVTLDRCVVLIPAVVST